MSKYINIVDLERLIKQKLSLKRYNHTMNVRDLAVEMGIKYNANIHSIEIAALLHDFTKEENAKIQLQTIEKSDIMLPSQMKKTPAVYHSKTAYLFAKVNLGIQDPIILNAIQYHTTGAKNMSLEEKIIYVSDAVSIDRKYKGVADYRKLALIDLDTCMLKIIKYSIDELLKKNLYIPTDTIECYNSLVEIIGGHK